jgi:hypothetical protein
MSGYRYLFLGFLALLILSIPATAPLVTAEGEGGRAGAGSSGTGTATAGISEGLPDGPVNPPASGPGPGSPDSVGFLTAGFPGTQAGANTTFGPDHDIAVGPTQIVQVSGMNLAVFDRLGGLLVEVPITAVAAFPEGHSLGSPLQVLYDVGFSRFILSWTTYNPVAEESQAWLAVSDPGNMLDVNYWASEPFVHAFSRMRVTATADKIVQTMDATSEAGTGHFFITWPKLEMTEPVTITYGFNGPRIDISSVVAVENHDVSDPNAYFVDVSSPGSLFVGVVSGPAAAPVLNEWAVSLPAQPAAPPVTQLDGPAFDVGGTQIASASMRNGLLWVARTIGRGEGEAAVASLEFMQIDVTMHTVEQHFPWGGDAVNLFRPAVTIDVGGNLHVTFNFSYSGSYPVAYATGQRVSDPANFMDGGVVLKESESPFLAEVSWGENGIAIDPTDPTTAWYSTSYIPEAGAWATWISAGSHASPQVTGLFRVTTNPPARTTILINGIPRDQWGLNWMKMPPGTYTLEFTDIPEYITPPPQEFTIVAGQTTTIQGEFVQMGQLRVITDPPAPSTIYVDGHPRNDWGMWMWVEPRFYEICFGSVPGWVAPPCQVAFVASGGYFQVVGFFTPVP